MSAFMKFLSLSIIGAVVTLAFAGVFAAVGEGEGIQVVALADAARAPVPVTVGVGRVLLLQAAPYRITVVTTSDPAVVHTVVRDTDALLVPMRVGSTSLALGLGGRLQALFRVTVGSNDTGLRVVALRETPARAVTAHTPTVPPAPRRAPAASAPAPRAISTPTVQGFLAGLTDTQRSALLAYVNDPTFATLGAVFRTLSPQQRDTLLTLVAQDSASLAQAARPAASSAPPAVAVAAPPIAAAPAVDSSAGTTDPSGIRVTAVTTRIGSALYVSYVLQNTQAQPVRADPHDLDITGASGDVTVRQMDLGDPGVISPGAMETGVITIAASSAPTTLTWRLHEQNGDVVPVAINVAPPVAASQAQE